MFLTAYGVLQSALEMSAIDYQGILKKYVTCYFHFLMFFHFLPN